MGYLARAYYSISPTRYYKDDSCWSADLKSKATKDIINIRNFMEVLVLNHYVLVRKIFIKPNVQYFHVFGSLCYPTNDHDDLGKMKPKADIGIFVGYLESSCGFRIYNRRTKKIMETIYVKFDELMVMDSECNNLEPGMNCPNFNDSSEDLQSVTSTSNLDNLFGPMYEEYYATRSQEVSDNSAANTLDNDHTSSSSSIVVEKDDAPQIVSFLEDRVDTEPNSPVLNEVSNEFLQEDVADFDGNMFHNAPPTLEFDVAESSSTYQDPSNMHQFHQQHRSIDRWTKNHPLEQVIGDPSKPIMTRKRLQTDAEVYELNQFKRLDVWELVECPVGRNIIKVKWIWKNKTDAENIVIRNKSRLVIKGYSQEEGIDFEKSFAPVPERRHGDDILLVQIYVDDIIFGSTKPVFAKRFEKLKKDNFEMSMIGDMKFFLGLLVHQSPRGIFICQSHYTMDILKKHGMEKCDTVNTPMATTKLDADLQDHAWCNDDCKSTSGGIQFLGEKLVSWSSKKQDCTAMSSAEAEYVSLSTCCAQVIWIRTQLLDYGFCYHKISIYCDSQSAIAISCNPVQHSRTKYINIRYYFIKEHVEKVLKEVVPEIAENAVNDLIENNLKTCIAATIIENRDAFRSAIPAFVSQEFKTHAPKIITELFKEYVQSNVIQVHLTIISCTTPDSSADLQYQLYLKMKSSLQDRANNITLWEALRRKFENSSTSNTSCRDDDFHSHHDEHQDDDAPPEGEKIVKRRKDSKRSKSTRGSSSKHLSKESIKYNVDKRVSTIFDRARMEATLRDSLSNLSRNAEEYAYHLEQSTSFMENQIVWERRQQDIPRTIPKTLIFYGPQRNPNEPPRPLYNKDLFFLKYGNTEEKKYILSLHKIHAEEFPDLEEKQAYVHGKRVIMKSLVKKKQKGAILELKRRHLKKVSKLRQYAVSNKEDTAYLRQLITRTRIKSIPDPAYPLLLNTPYAQLFRQSKIHISYD
ncbi:copia protein [Tanacetum coccineum]